MTWDWEPSIILGCVALAAGYLYFAHGRTALQTCSFLGGIVVLLLDLVSPIDTLADTYLFSAHVLQHFVLALVVPPLWLLGIPGSAAERVLQRRRVDGIEQALSRPGVSWAAGVGTMLAWHIPALFSAAIANDGLHILQHLSFLVSGAIFWWPVLAPVEPRRLAPLAAVVYLFGACTACSLLGAALTFTRPGWYPAYLNPTGDAGTLRLIRTGWGLDARTDQQFGGLLMWVPGCLVYLSAILARVAAWYRAPEPA
ncbi:MAG TPA: cytochrome c oxidase assembly protein [Bryobacteraceae bacterium]|nr:cytochrome c oxidase assembly protein [Bryobacteraceae bacterium]